MKQQQEELYLDFFKKKNSTTEIKTIDTYPEKIFIASDSMLVVILCVFSLYLHITLAESIGQQTQEKPIGATTVMQQVSVENNSHIENGNAIVDIPKVNNVPQGMPPIDVTTLTSEDIQKLGEQILEATNAQGSQEILDRSFEDFSRDLERLIIENQIPQIQTEQATR